MVEVFSTPEFQDNLQRYLPYLKDLRRKMLTVVGIFVTVTVFVGFNYQPILRFVISKFNLQGINMVLTSPNQIIELGIQTGIICGLLVTTPIFVYYLLEFLKPALRVNEYRLIISLIPVSLILFILGFAFGVWVMQFVISLFAQTALSMNMTNIWDISTFISQIVWSGLALGFLFQFPVILTILIRLKLISVKVLAAQRPLVYTLILIIDALLPPTDIFSMIFLAIPLFILFESTLLLNRKVK